MFHNLHTGWTVAHAAGPIPPELASLAEGIPAAVPGVIHLDLIAAELIEDPYVDDAESRLHWIGDSDWEYRLSFDWLDDGQNRHDLVADGLDTSATVTLNGVRLGRTANQHRSYRFAVDALLRAGRNDLVIHFDSPTRFAREQESILGVRPHSYEHPFNAIRKTACNFGWDWGIDVATSGIWKRIGIEGWSGARIVSVRPITDAADGRREVDIHVELEWDGAANVATISASGASSAASVDVEAGTSEVLIPLTGCRADLWWPRSHGAQPLYDLVVTVTGDGVATQTWKRKIGFRTISLDLAPDEIGSGFTIIVNGEPIFIRGANWIPDDTFFPRITKDSLRASVLDAVRSNMNLLRVWGGGLYESEEFYELCDEYGLLVWQDFLTACAAYSEDELLWGEFEAEAREAVTRLVAHPSLALWNGCNENIWGYVDWNWRSQLGDLTWGERYYTELFPSIVAELAPGTPYVEGSPFSFSRYLHPNDDKHGTTHIWDVWNQVDYDNYRSYRPRFVSEFGFQAAPSWSALEYAVHDEPMDAFGPNMLVHQKAFDGNGKLQRGMGDHLPYPADFEDWHWATQLNQARAITLGIEWFRSIFPENQGSIVWQLNDIWPAVSWAAVDHLRHRKPLWFALRNIYADRLLTFQPAADGRLELVLHNDSPEALEDSISVTRRALDGRVLTETTIEAKIEARGLQRWSLPDGVVTPGDAANEYIWASGPSLGAYGYFAEDTVLRLQDDLDATAVVAGDGYAVTVQARSLTKDLTVLADKVHPDAACDEALVTLSAGQSHTFRVSGPAGLDLRMLASARVVRSANDLIDPTGMRTSVGAA